MQTTIFKTYSIPAGGPTATPNTIASGTAVSVRAVVRNRGANMLFFGDNAEALISPEGPTSDTIELPPGETDVYVLAPGQRLFAIGAGAGGRASVSVSEVLPLGAAAL